MNNRGNLGLPAVSEHSVFDSVTSEYDIKVADIQGRLPKALIGTLYRNGPSQWQPDAGHVFDGNGMISQFVFQGGQLRYPNRFVRTPKFLAEAEGKQVRGVGSLRTGGRWENMFHSHLRR